MAEAVDLKAQMNQLIRGYWTTQAIFVAAELRIADLLADGPKAPDELGRAAGVKGDMLYRVLRALASIGIIVLTFAGLALDIRDRRRTELEADRMRGLANAAVEGLIVSDGETVVILTMPSSTPIQCSALSPLWLTYSPWLYSCTTIARRTRSRCSGLRSAAHTQRSTKSFSMACKSSRRD